MQTLITLALAIHSLTAPIGSFHKQNSHILPVKPVHTHISTMTVCTSDIPMPTFDQYFTDADGDNLDDIDGTDYETAYSDYLEDLQWWHNESGC